MVVWRAKVSISSKNTRHTGMHRQMDNPVTALDTQAVLLRPMPLAFLGKESLYCYQVLKRTKMLWLAETACPGDDWREFFSFNLRVNCLLSTWLIGQSNQPPCTHLLLFVTLSSLGTPGPRAGLCVLHCGNSRPRTHKRHLHLHLQRSG